MTINERELIRYVCEGDILKAQAQASVLLKNVTTKKDEAFTKSMLEKLAKKPPRLIELPYNLQDVLVAKSPELFPIDRFLKREGEEKVTEKILIAYSAAEELEKINISYVPSLLLYGVPGTGKTMLAQYIAYKANLPFIHIRFSALINSLLGGTQSKLAKIFEYARSVPCVLCIDEIDAIGIERGRKDDVGEMSRIVISLMQELDRLPNNVIVIGTTNRIDCLDAALLRRFSVSRKIELLEASEAITLAKKIFNSVGIDSSKWFADWNVENITSRGLYFSPADIDRRCKEYIVELICSGKWKPTSGEDEEVNI